MSDQELRESVSALMDGELPPARAARTLDTLLGDAALREQWRRHHRISAALAGQHDHDADALAARVREALEREPVPLPARPARRRWSPALGTAGVAASAAAVAVVVTLAMTRQDSVPDRPAPVAGAGHELARPVVVAARDEPGALRDGAALTRMTWNDAAPAVEKRLNGYLLNHNEYLSGGVRGLLPYARVVGYDPRN